MPYYNAYGDLVQNEYDEKMTRKFGDRYRSVKNIYPDVYKLPENEIKTMTNIIRFQGNSMEEAEDYLKKHIDKYKPSWEQTYSNGTTNQAQATPPLNFAPQPQTMQQKNPFEQIKGAYNDMSQEYFKMKNHDYVKLDDYHHCKANYNATKQGPYGEDFAQKWGLRKEIFDKYKNKYYKGLDDQVVKDDFIHDLNVNAIGRARAKFGDYNSAEDACADYRSQNTGFPEKWW